MHEKSQTERARGVRRCRRSLVWCLGGAIVAVGCGDDGGSGSGADASVRADAGDQSTPAAAWFFGADPDSNAWTVTIVDPADPDLVIDSFMVDDLAALSGPQGNDQGPSWGDAVPSTDERRLFVNAGSVNKVAVFETEGRTLEALLDVGERPVHMWNPNHGDEIWTHVDGPGAFFVIDQTSLSVSDPVVAALDGAGHGKLLYAEELGTSYYATNTNDPGAFPIDGSARQAGEIISVCDTPCEGNPQETCGSTHDKAYNPAMGFALFQCSGDARGTYGFVDTSDDSVAEDLVEISGSIAHSEGNEYILVIDGGADADQVQIWDTRAAGHDGVTFDATVTVDGEPSARGTHFRENGDGEWEAWIPQTAGSEVAVVNLTALEVELVEIGTLTKPEGASHFSRRGGIGGDWFFSYNDDGVVVVDLDTREVTQGPALAGLTARIAYVDPDGQE